MPAGHRRRPQPLLVDLRDGARGHAQLRLVQVADRTSSWPTCSQKFDKTFGATKAAERTKCGKVEGDRTTADIAKRRADRWNFLFIAGIWFQDLFNYDFRRTEMCIIPYATQQGEISLLRLQHRHPAGATSSREDAHDGDRSPEWYGSTAATEIFAGGKNGAARLDRASS